MSDISTLWDVPTGFADWSMGGAASGFLIDENGAQIVDEHGVPLVDGIGLFDIIIGDDLASAVLISLFTDATAADDDVIPDGTTDRRGWWAGSIGSKIWLRLRSKRSPQLLALVQDDIATALQWMLDDGVATSIDTTLEWQSPNQLGCSVVITRQRGPAQNVKFAWAWEQN